MVGSIIKLAAKALKKKKKKRISNYPFGKGPRPVEYYTQYDQFGFKGITGTKKRRRKKLHAKKP
jgi:hypothetical protein